MYPIMLQLKNKKVVVIGGGAIAERKVLGLLPEKAKITVVSPTVTAELLKLAEAKNIQWHEKRFLKEDIQDAFLIFAATDDPSLNSEIKLAAKEGQLVYMADHPDEADFKNPSLLKRGRLTITVSTDGASPILAKKIKQQLESQFDERYESYLDFLFQKRQWILKEIENPALKRKLLIAIAQHEFFQTDNREAEFEVLYGELKDHFQ
ncbi:MULTISPECIES: NAD(P)-binding protein [unclassified Bacillus (in: firmicutes)]|uniref:NAD(P)-binding protein n=1 Tax=unclassified Bacillus (in: firmicutes) TaxID=185979 RepID=UPI0008E9683B|nr:MULTISPECIES: NAD(P)-binding protein [unclassified Bacillus (in: firmicutes)]SFB23458.1 precorrin-2 dehydrogenase / sirohydrochlorin ferrochelatase [Bacillus sp. UNCCL13]SFQ87768.1 precorrin-2 dehydrogenase [Bacillus sp. cl95]